VWRGVALPQRRNAATRVKAVAFRCNLALPCRAAPACPTQLARRLHESHVTLCACVPIHPLCPPPHTAYTVHPQHLLPLDDVPRPHTVVLALDAAPAVAAIFAASKGARVKENSEAGAAKVVGKAKRRKTAGGCTPRAPGESAADGLRVGDLPLVSLSDQGEVDEEGSGRFWSAKLIEGCLRVRRAVVRRVGLGPTRLGPLGPPA